MGYQNNRRGILGGIGGALFVGLILISASALRLAGDTFDVTNQNTSGPGSFSEASAGASAKPGSTIQFSGAANGIVTIGALTANNLTLTTVGDVGVFLTGPITGNGPLNFNSPTVGLAAFFVDGNNTFTGLTTIQNGYVELGAFGYTAIPGDVLIDADGILSINQNEQIADTSTVTNNGSLGFFATFDSQETIKTLLGDSYGLIYNATADTSATLIVSDGDFYGEIIDGSGTVALVKQGTGTLTLRTADTYTGGTTINGGTLLITDPEALGFGDVHLANGTLGTTDGNHLISVGGNYTQDAGGVLTLTLYSSTVYDSLDLTGGSGTASLSGTLKLVVEGNVAPGASQQFKVVTTNNPISGQFSAISGLPSIDITNVDYTDDVTITISQLPFANLPGVGLTPNQAAVATYLDAHDQNITDPDFGNLIGALNGISDDPQALAGAFDQLTSLNFANFASSTAFNNTSFLTQQFDDYLANHRNADGSFVSSEGGIDYSGLAINDPNIDTALQSTRSRLLAWCPAANVGLLSDSSSLVTDGTDMKEVVAPGASTNPWNVFVTGNVVLSQNFSDNSAGLPYSTSTTGAVEVGVDYKITPHWLIGAAFGYGHTHADLDNIGSNATVNTYSPAVYTSYADKGWYVNGLASYGFSNYSQNRNVSIPGFGGTASSSPGGDQIVGNIDGGYDFHRGPWTFGPTLGLQYVHLTVDGYSETGLPGADLNVNQNDSDSLRSRLGGTVNYTIKTANLIFTPHFSASWQHEFMDQSRGITAQFNSVGAGSFQVNTPNPSRDSALIDLGLDAQIDQTTTLFFDYLAQAGQSNYFGQSVQLGVKIGF